MMPQQRLLAVTTSERTSDVTPGLLALGAAAKFLAERDICGIVWLDRLLIVKARFGPMVDFVMPGRPISDSVLALVGLEDDIKALTSDDAAGVVEMPAVAMMTPSGVTPRANISIFWFAKAARHLVLFARASSPSDLEAQLVAQMRARLMAEAEVSAKSRELARANAELSRANADLEDFASIISHDLSAPMRRMRYLLDDLEARLDGTSDEAVGEAGKLVEALKAQTIRMSSMMRGLHEYSTIGRKQDAVEQVDTRRLIESICGATHCPPGFAVSISGAWPVIETLAAPLDLVLRNLIDNAIKHHDAEQGLINVRCTEADGELVLSVRDDGPGIDEASRSAVFLPFRTLGKQGAGTGMGLAFVRRTVESVGGSLELVSPAVNGRGSEFRIRWPNRMRSSALGT